MYIVGDGGEKTLNKRVILKIKFNVNMFPKIESLEVLIIGQRKFELTTESWEGNSRSRASSSEVNARAKATGQEK